MRVRTNIGGGMNVGIPQQPVQTMYNAPIMTNGSVQASSLPVVDMTRQAVNVFEGVKPIQAIGTGGTSMFNAEKAYDCIMTLMNMTPTTPEMVVFATRLKELGNAGQFNASDSRSLDKVMSAIITSALDELIDRDQNKYAMLMENICSRAVTDVSLDNVSKWIGSGSGTGFRGGSLVQQAVNAFRSYMADNGLTRFDNISKFKKHFNNFAAKRAEYKDVLVSEAWSVFNGGVR